MQNAKARASKNCRMVISSPKKSDQNQKLQHRTRAGSHVLHRPRHHHPARLTCQREPARLPWWCSRSYRAASTAWGIDASTACITGECAINPLVVKRHCIDPTITRLARDPCAARGRAILDLIAGIYGRARARVFALVFGFHSLDHNLPFD